MIYTFYSFKGGVGRSMAMANVAEYFYRKGLRVGIVDWDLEAPGLETFYFDPRSDEGKEQLRKVRSQLGLVDIVLTYKDHYSSLKFPSDQVTANETSDNPPTNRVAESSVPTNFDQDTITKQPSGDGEPISSAESDKLAGEKEEVRVKAELDADVAYLKKTLTSIKSYLFPIHPPGSLKDHPKAALHLLGAGWREGERFESYSFTVQSLNWSELYINYKGEAFFEWMRSELEDFDVILIDSRTGVTEMGSVCTKQLPDVVVSCSVLNNQNMYGVASMNKSFKREEVLKARHGRPIETIVVPTRIDTAEIDARATLIDAFDRIMGPVPIEFEQVNTSYWNMGIPYVGKYAYFERLAIGSTDRAYELQNAYKSLATHLVLLAPKDSLLRTKLAEDLKQILRVTESPVPHMAPSLPSAFVERPAEIGKLKEALRPRTDGTQQEPVVLCGPPGSGKSTIAAAFAREGDIVEAFKDGILWVTLGARPNVIEAIAGLHAKITGDARTFETEDEAVRHLSAKLFDKVCLIIIDDLCNLAHQRPFTGLGGQISYLITTRDPDLVPSTAAKQFQVERLSQEQAFELVAAVSKFPVGHQQELSDFVCRLARRPLALKLAGDMLRQRVEFVGDEPLTALSYANLILSEKGVTSFDKSDTPDRNQSVAKSIAASLDFLTAAELERYVELALALDRKKLSVEEVRRLWGDNHYELKDVGSHDMEVEKRLQRLHALSLVRYDVKSKMVQLDSEIRNNLLAELPGQVGLHLRAESIFSKFSPDQQLMAKHLLIRLVKLRGPGSSEGDVRSRVSFRNLDDSSRSIVKTLVDGKILIQEEDRLTKEQKVQFADESLIKKWSRLREWIDSDRDFLLWLQQIRPSLNAWNGGQRDALLRGEELTTAKAWLSRQDLDQSVRTYVTLSDQTNRSRIWKRVGVILITAVLLAAAVFTIWRWNQSRKQQQEQSHIKHMEGVDAAARRDYDRAILLYNQALPASNEPAAVYYNRGNAYSSKGDYNQAISDFTEAIKRDQRVPQYYLSRSDALLKAGDKEGAAKDLNIVLQMAQNDPELTKIVNLYIQSREGTPTPTPSPQETPAPPLVYIQYQDVNDRDQIVFIQTMLQKGGYNVSGIQLVAAEYRPQVRYYYEEDANNARAVRSVVVNSLKQLNFPLNVSLIKMSKPGNAKKGQIEVWLPSLQLLG